MNYLRKIPLLLGIGAALLIGLIGYASGVPNKDNILNILMGMVIFYLVGIFIRSTIKNIIENTIIKILKKQEEDRKHQLDVKREEERKDRDKTIEKTSGKNVDLVADDKTGPDMGDEDFGSLPIADFIKKELK